MNKIKINAIEFAKEIKKEFATLEFLEIKE